MKMREIFILIFFSAVISARAQIIESERVFPPLLDGKDSCFLRTDQECIGSISLVAVGDLMLGGSALSIIRQKGANYPFDACRTILQSADIAFGNLEAPFTKGGEPFDKTFTFRVPPEFGQGVSQAGFDVLSLANNHILDYGMEGLFSTLHVLDSLRIAYCGAGESEEEAESAVVLRRGGFRVGFLAYSMTYPDAFWATKKKGGTAYPYLSRLKKSLYLLQEKTDLIVVSFHWGEELKAKPKPYQRLYAHCAVDWGADLVVGHHPHVLQGLELYKGVLIAYSLGNFVFGSYSRHARESIILKVRFDRQGFLLAEIIPISVCNDEVQFQPRVLDARDRDKVIQKINEISTELNQGRRVLRDSGLVVVDQ